MCADVLSDRLVTVVCRGGCVRALTCMSACVRAHTGAHASACASIPDHYQPPPPRFLVGQHLFDGKLTLPMRLMASRASSMLSRAFSWTSVSASTSALSLSARTPDHPAEYHLYHASVSCIVTVRSPRPTACLAHRDCEMSKPLHYCIVSLYTTVVIVVNNSVLNVSVNNDY